MPGGEGVPGTAAMRGLLRDRRGLFVAERRGQEGREGVDHGLDYEDNYGGESQAWRKLTFKVG